ncbi:MAG: hypothetical protein ACUVWN_14770, partial [bacterium]
MYKQDRYWKYFDEAWKKIIERFFPQLIDFFIPELYKDIDLSKGVSFLDTEMEQLSKGSKKGAKYVDKLAKVCLKNGKEQWVLIHIEVQGYKDKEFPKRMFRYFYRIFDKCDERIVSLALLAGYENLEDKFEFETYGSGVVFRYLAYRLMKYNKEQLKNDNNPVALVVLACQEKEIAERKGEAFNIKINLIKSMYEKGYKKEEIIALFDFIDWILKLSNDEEEKILEEVRALEEVKNMPYLNSIKRIAIREGRKEGR